MRNRENRRRERIDRGIKVRSEGIYAVSSWREASYLIAPRLLVFAALLLPPLLAPNLYWQRVICLAGIYAMLALSFDFLTNFVGLVSLGGALFMGVGGYLSGTLNKFLGLPVPISIIVATLVGAAVCTALLLPCLPLRGIYFAIATLIYPLLLARVVEATGVVGGTEGLPGLAAYPNVWTDVYVIVGATALALFGLRRLLFVADLGAVFKGIKDNDLTIKAVGINITTYKSLAVFIASAIGCFAGAYLCHLYGWVGLSYFALDYSILPISAALIGGMGTLFGPLLGAAILVPLSEVLRDFGPLRIVFYSFILILFIALNPEGLMSYFQRKYSQFERWVEV